MFDVIAKNQNRNKITIKTQKTDKNTEIREKKGEKERKKRGNELLGRSGGLSASSWCAPEDPRYEFEGSRIAPGTSLGSFRELLGCLWARF